MKLHSSQKAFVAFAEKAVGVSKQAVETVCNIFVKLWWQMSELSLFFTLHN